MTLRESPADRRTQRGAGALYSYAAHRYPAMVARQSQDMRAPMSLGSLAFHRLALSGRFVRLVRLTVMLFRRLHVPGRFGQDLPGAVIDGTVLAWRRLDSFGHAEVLIQHFEAGRGMIGTRPRGG